MKTIKVEDLDKVDTTTIEEISSYIRQGKIAILPTGTVYGISCVYNNKIALQKVYEIKKRQKNLPFIILISKLSDLDGLIDKKSKSAIALIEIYWNRLNPLPLTLIFEKSKSLDLFITSGSNKIAIRRAELKLLQSIIDICGPIISTSANISGQNISPKLVEEIPQEIRQEVDLIVSYSRPLSGIASTILDTTQKIPSLIREGEVKYNEVLDYLKATKKI